MARATAPRPPDRTLHGNVAVVAELRYSPPCRAAVLRGYQLDPADELHGIRMLRSVLHGFATPETADGLQLTTDADDSYTWMIDFLVRGLTAGEGTVTGTVFPA